MLGTIRFISNNGYEPYLLDFLVEFLVMVTRYNYYTSRGPNAKLFIVKIDWCFFTISFLLLFARPLLLPHYPLLSSFSSCCAASHSIYPIFYHIEILDNCLKKPCLPMVKYDYRYLLVNVNILNHISLCFLPYYVVPVIFSI